MGDVVCSNGGDACVGSATQVYPFAAVMHAFHCPSNTAACASRRSTDSYEQIFFTTFIYITTIATDDTSVIADASTAIAVAIGVSGDGGDAGDSVVALHYVRLLGFFIRSGRACVSLSIKYRCVHLSQIHRLV